MATCAHNPAYVSKPKQKAPAGGKGEWANSPYSFQTKKKKKKKQLRTHTGEPSL